MKILSSTQRAALWALLGIVLAGGRVVVAAAGKTTAADLQIAFRPVPPETSLMRVSDPQSPSSVKAADKLAALFGIGLSDFRRVIHQGVAQPGSLARAYVIVQYCRADTKGFGEIPSGGVEVWIDKLTGKATVVPTEVTHAAYRQAIEDGIDLTRYDRIVARQGSLYYVSLLLRLPPGFAVLDGCYLIKVDVKSLKVKGLIKRWGPVY